MRQFYYDIQPIASFFKKHWLTISVIVILLLGSAILIYVFKHPPPADSNWADKIFIFLDEWAAAGGPALTFLGIATALYMSFRALNLTKDIREKDRKERLLNEIIEWAKDIIKLRSDNLYKELLQFSVTNDNKKLLQFFKAEIMEHKGVLSSLVIQGQYINIISSSFGEGIQGSVKPLSIEIDKLVNYLDDWRKALSNQIEYHNNELDIVSVAGQADEMSTRIDTFAKNLLDEVAKIKAKINNNPHI